MFKTRIRHRPVLFAFWLVSLGMLGWSLLSCRVVVAYTLGSRSYFVANGVFWIEKWPNKRPHQGFMMRWHDVGGFKMWWDFATGSPSPQTIRFAGSKSNGAIPLHLPILFLLGVSSFLFWRPLPYQRLMQCQTCGYDLRGNASGRCPECGEAVA